LQCGLNKETWICISFFDISGNSLLSKNADEYKLRLSLALSGWAISNELKQKSEKTTKKTF